MQDSLNVVCLAFAVCLFHLHGCRSLFSFSFRLHGKEMVLFPFSRPVVFLSSFLARF